MDPNKLAAIFSDQARMLQLVESIQKIDAHIAGIADRIGAITIKTNDGLDKAKRSTDDIADNLSRSEKSLEDMHALSEKTLTTWDRISAKFKGIVEHVKEARAGIEKFGFEMHRLQTSPANSIQNILMTVPYVGPMLMMAMQSAVNKSAQQTAGRQSMLQFRGREGLDSGEVQSAGVALGATIKRLEDNFLATRAGVKATFGAIVEGGGKAVDATKDLDFEVEGFGKTVFEVALGLDAAFGLAEGSAMKFGAQLSRDTGVALTDSVKLVKDLGLASRNTGMDMQSFVGTIIQMTGALRVQGAEAKNLASAYMNIENLFGQAMPGRSTAQIAELSKGALVGMQQTVAGMSESLKGAIARDVAREVTKEDMSTLAAMRKMETGALGPAGQDWTQATIKVLFQFMSSRIKNDDHLFQALTKVGNMPALTAEALIRARKGGVDLTDNALYAKALQDHAEELKKAEKLQPLNTDSFERMMNRIMQLMDAIGRTMLSFLALILKGIVGMVEVLASDDKGDAFKRYGTMMKGGLSDVGTSMANVGAAAMKLLGESGAVLGDFGIGNIGSTSPNGGWSILPPSEKKKQAQAAEEAGRRNKEIALRSLVGRDKVSPPSAISSDMNDISNMLGLGRGEIPASALNHNFKIMWEARLVPETSKHVSSGVTPGTHDH